MREANFSRDGCCSPIVVLSFVIDAQSEHANCSQTNHYRGKGHTDTRGYGVRCAEKNGLLPSGEMLLWLRVLHRDKVTCCMRPVFSRGFGV